MELLNKLPMPGEMSKKEIVDLLLKEEYGDLPPAPIKVYATEVETYENFCAGTAHRKQMLLTCEAEFGTFTFPFTYTKKTDTDQPVPCFIHINFRPDVPDRYQPSEEINDAGYSVISFGYKDVTSDDGDFANGLAGVVYKDGKQTEDGCGKIGLWAWAAMRLMDYAQTLPELDKARISVCGHSRLGKTALLAGALDERFYCAFSNCSGCSGAALARENTGETIKDIVNKFPFWFKKSYAKYIDNEAAMPFDQHYLIAANVPHLVYVASAEKDLWACPENEYMACIAASDYYKKHTGCGFVHPDRLAKVGEAFHEGNIGYHYRTDTHYFSRRDWQQYVQFLEQHK